jgi:hypothetical protein
VPERSPYDTDALKEFGLQGVAKQLEEELRPETEEATEAEGNEEETTEGQ